VIFAFHGYPALIHRLTYRRSNHAGLHVRGYKEKGTEMLASEQMERIAIYPTLISNRPSV
jgi:xylulose-5-phosphate/fructose-6-phosphate phosphoketolase